MLNNFDYDGIVGMNSKNYRLFVFKWKLSTICIRINTTDNFYCNKKYQMDIGMIE